MNECGRGGGQARTSAMGAYSLAEDEFIFVV